MTATEPVTSRYLAGNYAPVTDELTELDLAVTGTIPAELDGRYLRNGPNPRHRHDPATYHWFTGDGMVHGVRLRDGQAEWYRNRWVRSAEVARPRSGPTPAEPAAGRPPTGPCSPPTPTSSASPARTFAIVEAGGRAGRADRRARDVGPTRLRRHAAEAVHRAPEARPGTGELHVVPTTGAGATRSSTCGVGARRPGAHARSTSRRPGQPMVHDMSFTDAVRDLSTCPVMFDLEAAMAGDTLPVPLERRLPARDRAAARATARLTMSCGSTSSPATSSTR